MASKNFSGTLSNPLGESAEGDKYIFTHLTTTGEVISDSLRCLEIGENGQYDIDIEYGTVSIDRYNKQTKRWVNKGVVTISSETTETTLPALLLATTPATPELVLQLEAILADAESAADRAEAAADSIPLYGTAATKDVITSQSDRTAGRVLTTGAGGLLGNAVTISSADSAPLGVFCTSGQLTHAEAVAAGFPDLGTSDSAPVWWNLQTYGVANRQTQIATQIFRSGVNARNETYTRVKQDSIWHEWVVNYTGSNLDVYSVGGVSGEILATGQATSSAIRVMIPAVLPSSPTSISVTGSFSVSSWGSTINLEEDITAIAIASGQSSRSMIYLNVPVSFSPTTGTMYNLKSNSADAKIRFNV